LGSTAEGKPFRSVGLQRGTVDMFPPHIPKSAAPNQIAGHGGFQPVVKIHSPAGKLDGRHCLQCVDNPPKTP
jgi:hypothetical protein